MAPEEVEKLSDTLAGPHHGVPFMDITEHPEVFPVVESGNTSQAIYSANEINHAMSFIDLSNPQENLQYLTGVVGPLQNRRHNTADGAAAARWIRDIMQGYCDQLDRSGRCSVSTFTSPRTPQLSVILRREGSNNPNRQVVIIGGHLDSIAGSNVRAPGADDDGSGTVTVMEAARAFLAAGTDNALTLEFQLYAAEEVGLWGSGDLANSYRTRGINVKSMVQFDMNGCCAAGRGLTRGTRYNVCTDAAFTNSALTARLRTVITNFGDLPQGNFQYGYAASDHASFARAGFPACHVKENVGYPPIHSPNDVYANIDFVYLGSFVRVAIGFAITESNARVIMSDVV